MSPRGEVQPVIERQPLWWLPFAGVVAVGVELGGAALGTEAGDAIAGLGLAALLSLAVVFGAMYQARKSKKD